MNPSTLCDLCGQPATRHMTDATMRPPLVSHFCEDHSPDDIKSIAGSALRQIWQEPATRESAIDFFADELGEPRESVCRRLETWVAQTDGQGDT